MMARRVVLPLVMATLVWGLCPGAKCTAQVAHGAALWLPNWVAAVPMAPLRLQPAVAVGGMVSMAHHVEVCAITEQQTVHGQERDDTPARDGLALQMQHELKALKYKKRQLPKLMGMGTLDGLSLQTIPDQVSHVDEGHLHSQTQFQLRRVRARGARAVVDASFVNATPLREGTDVYSTVGAEGTGQFNAGQALTGSIPAVFRFSSGYMESGVVQRMGSHFSAFAGARAGFYDSFSQDALRPVQGFQLVPVAGPRLGLQAHLARGVRAQGTFLKDLCHMGNYAASVALAISAP